MSNQRKSQPKLRPNTWDELIGLEHKPINETDTQKDILISMAQSGYTTMLMFIGPSGTGKTSAARLFAADVLHVAYSEIEKAVEGKGSVDYLEINASGERGIDVIRRLDHDYISIPSLTNTPKVLVFDEADGLTYQAQETLKAITERSKYNVVFIFCLNKFHRMDKALVSRSAIFYFDPIPIDHSIPWLKSKCQLYEITISDTVIRDILEYYKGDLRQVVNSFLEIYKGKNITKWKPKRTYSESIFKAKSPSDRYLTLASKEFLNAEDLISELFILNNYQNPVVFAKASLLLSKGSDPTIAVLYAITGLVK